MMKILITGFGAFLDNKTNPSQKVCETLAGAQYRGFTLKTQILPVAYFAAASELKKVLQNFEPEVVMCLGLAADRTHLEIEKVALNFRNATGPDNNGLIATDEVIDPLGPGCFYTTLPYREMLAACERVQVKAALSLSAGSYVCNEVFYTLMNLKARAKYAGFIHLPPNGEQDFLKVLPLWLENFGRE